MVSLLMAFVCGERLEWANSCSRRYITEVLGDQTFYEILRGSERRVG